MTNHPQIPDKPGLPAPIEMDAEGVYALRTQSDQARIAKMFWDHGVVSKRSFQTPLQVQVGIQAIKALGLQPAVALRQTGFINGAFTVWGDIGLAIIRNSGQLEWIREICYVNVESRIKADEKLSAEDLSALVRKGAKRVGHDLVFTESQERCFKNSNLHLPPDGAVCVMKRAGEEHPVEYAFSVEDAKRAGLWGKPGPWTNYPQIMLMRRARAVCIQKGFSDLTHCVAQAENDVEGVPEYWADARTRQKLERNHQPSAPLDPKRVEALGAQTRNPPAAEREEAIDRLTGQSDDVRREFDK